ncbi:SIR2 family protein [Enterococcus faecium]|uniref:SIR2 family protein n=1 Tax=Enterococcus faecium TaxID=1352 RepID=UPI0024B9D1D5|nr:SIR2 family protein [Enterococcus faecium]
MNKHIKNEVLLNSIITDILKLDAEYIITTNYDDLLEKTSLLLCSGYEESRDISSFQGFESLDETQYIFHIHGTIKIMIQWWLLMKIIIIYMILKRKKNPFWSDKQTFYVIFRFFYG